MIQRVVSAKGFWKSVVVLGIMYAFVLFFLKWAFSGFSSEMFSTSITNYLIFLLCGMVAGLFSAFGKYWAKIKQDDYKR